MKLLLLYALQSVLAYGIGFVWGRIAGRHDNLSPLVPFILGLGIILFGIVVAVLFD